MYLEPIQSFSAFPVPSNAVMCSSNTKYAGRILYGKADVNSESGCGGIVKQVTPPAPTLSSALFSYDLTGTATWSYPSCKTGYTRKASGKAHPNAYTCFKSAASTPPPAATPKPPACPPSMTFENMRQQVLAEASINANQDYYAMQNGRSATSANILKTLQPCPFYEQSAALYRETYQKYIQGRPQMAYRA